MMSIFNSKLVTKPLARMLRYIVQFPQMILATRGRKKERPPIVRCQNGANKLVGPGILQCVFRKDYTTRIGTHKTVIIIRTYKLKERPIYESDFHLLGVLAIDELFRDVIQKAHTRVRN